MAKELSDKSQEEQRELDDLGKILKKRDKGTAIRVEEDFIYGKVGGREVMLMLRSKYDRYKKLLSKYKSPQKKADDEKVSKNLYKDLHEFFSDSNNFD